MKHNTIWLTKSAIDVSIHRKTDEYNYCLRAVSLINWTTPSSSLLDLGMIDSNTIASPNLPFRKTSCFIWWFHPAARLAFQLSRSNNQPQFWSTRLTNFHNTQRHPSKPFRPRCPQKKKTTWLVLGERRTKIHLLRRDLFCFSFELYGWFVKEETRGGLGLQAVERGTI